MVSVKRYLWLIHLALIAAGVYIGSDLFWAIVGSRIEPGSRVPIASSSVAAATTEQRTLQQYAVIQERNLFGAKGRSSDPRPPPPPSQPPPSKPAINLKLVGTVVGPPERTYAVIEDLSSKRQDLYRVGDVVREAKVVEVTRNRVVLDNRGRREELFSFEKSDSVSAPPSGPPARQSAAPRRPPFALESPPGSQRRIHRKNKNKKLSMTPPNRRWSGSVRTSGESTVMTWLNSWTISGK